MNIVQVRSLLDEVGVPPSGDNIVVEKSPMDDAFVHSVTERYVELYERLTGQAFLPAPTGDIHARVQRAVEGYLERV